MRKALIAGPVALFLMNAAPAAAYDNIALAGAVSFKKAVSRAAGAAATPGGDWLLSDAGAGTVRVFSPDGKPKGAIGAKGKGPDQLGEPRGLAVDAEGRVYAADAGRHRVAVFSRDGKFLLSLGTKGAGAGELDAPSGAAVSADGVVYVADTGNDRVQAFSRDGIFLLGFGAPGEGNGRFKDPSAVAVSPAGRVYVMDQKRVQVFTPDGTFIAALPRPKLSPKDKEAPAPVGLASDAFGAVYVAGAHQKIEEYGPDGKYIASFGTEGAGAGQFKELSGLAAAPGGVLLAVDAGLQRVQGFKVTAADRPAPVTPRPTLRYAVRALESRPFTAEDIAFAGDALAGVAVKADGVLLLRPGAKAPEALGRGRGKGLDQLDGPAGLFAAGDRLWIADRGNGRVLAWGLDGKPAAAAAVGSPGKREGQFKEPAAVAVDAQGRLLVADPAQARVQLFSADGIFLRALPGPFQSPVDVAPLPGGGAAVLDAGRKALLFFDDKGRSAAPPVEGFLQPLSLASDPRGKLDFLYVLDAGDDQVKVVSHGAVVARFGSRSLFQAPKALALDGRGRLWAADAAGVKSFEVRLSPLSPSAFDAKPGEAEVALSWKPDPENMADAFRLYRSTAPAGGDREPYRVFAATETSFMDREIVPGLTYYYALSAVADDADGKNPLEGARAEAKAATARPANLPPVELSSIELRNIFSAQYKFYEANPVGRVTIKNNTEKTFQRVRVGFILQNYMDFVTEKVIDRFEPGALETLDLKATFNNKVLSVTEDTPIQAQLTVTYYDNGEEKVFRRAEPLTLYSRNAMTWEDPRRLATFITAKDPAALEFARAAVRDFRQEIEGVPVNPALARAAVVFETLGAFNLSYLKDPNNPFEKVSEDAKAVDYVQYPRETLKRRTGDCDDLTALTAALLEAVSVNTAIVDVPGHVLLAFQLDDDWPLDPGLPDGTYVERDGVRWVPLETTFVGRPFMDAWEQGAKLLRNAPEDKVRVLDVHDAWTAYPPATLAEEPGPEAPRKEEVAKKFPSGGPAALAARRLEVLSAKYEAALKDDPKDADARLQLGLLLADHGALDKSAEAFDAVIAQDPANASALNDRGNVAWMKGDAPKALELYRKAAEADPKDAGVRVNLARAALKAKDRAGAKKAFDEALALDPGLKKDLSSVDDLAK